MKWQYLEKKSLEKIQDKIENYNKAINLLKVGI